MNAVAETESAPEGASLETTGPIPDHAGHAGQPTVAAGRTGNAQGPVPARVTHSETTAATDADGFRTVVRRQAHTRHSDLDSKPELRQQTSEEKSDVRLAELTACNGATSHARGDHPDASVRANLDTYPSVGTRQRGQKSKAKAKQQAKPPAFAKFKKAMAMGKFALLHDDDSDDNADVSDDEPDEAPYAYEPAPLTPKEVVHEALGQYGALAEEDSEDEVDGSNKDAMSDIASDDDSQRHMDVQSAEGCHDDSVSRRDTTATYSPFPHKDETSARVTGQPNATTGQMGKETSAMVQTTLTSFVTSAGEVIDTLRTAASPVAHAENDFVPGSPDSQQEFTIGTTHRATPDGDHTEPIRVAQFLDSFDGILLQQ
ncbi:hypothetical protein PR002_g29822 [Phytophthora rubi]|uniref:Uncharacterized protein n=1 Tax=Phytophthora rubi TaxID=129364 RepID=A0A6A3GXC0_9STRA|nr:hypothetical protein PR002_g29822 [Phytophthora rubi]